MATTAGRLIDHIQLRVGDLEASRRFYRACLDALGVVFTDDADDHFAVDELYVDAGRRPRHGRRVHLAFQAADRAAVDRFHAAGLAAGGRDNGAPGERAYHPGYYAAFLLDPDGNNVEAVHHGPATRSAAWVETTPGLADAPPQPPRRLHHRLRHRRPRGAAAFWRAALGDGKARKPQGKYVRLDPRSGLHVEVQRVDIPPRVHLDIASDDVPAEVARLERLGARKVAEVRTWVVMEAPTGHRFCVIRARGADFAGHRQRSGTTPDGEA